MFNSKLVATFSFSYRLVGPGWAEVGFQAENTRYQFHASSVDTPLEKLLGALLGFWVPTRQPQPGVSYEVRDGKRTHTFRWLGEPLTLCWTLTRPDPRTVLLQLHEAPDWDEAPEETPVFKLRMDFFDFCHAISSALNALLQQHGTAGYEAEWGHAFPLKEFRALQEFNRIR